MYLLDTDTTSLFLRGREPVQERILAAPPADIWISIVTVEEMLRGSLSIIHQQRAPGARGAVAAYASLLRLLNELSKFQVLAYDDRVEEVYRSLPPEAKRAGQQDCRIAASAIAKNFTVVTGNQRDFSRILGDTFEDWNT